MRSWDRMERESPLQSKMLTTLLHPTGGKIILNGHDPMHNKDGVRKSLGIVFQDPSLDDDLTGLENMQFHAMCYKVPKDIRNKQIEELLKFVELWERKNDFVKTFSGGMKRRLEIARGLLHHPTYSLFRRADSRTRSRRQEITCGAM